MGHYDESLTVCWIMLCKMWRVTVCCPQPRFPGEKGKGQQMTVTRTVALLRPRHGVWSVTCCFRTDDMCAHRQYQPFGTANSGVDSTHNHQGILNLFSPPKIEEEIMIQKFHGLDRHKKHSTISVLNREGQEVEFVSKCYDLRGYIEQLGPEDAVVMEAATGAFFWADIVESRPILQ